MTNRNELKVFEQREVLGKQFRIYGDLDNPLFLAKDVMNWLDMDVSQVKKFINKIDEDEKVRNNVTTLGGIQNTWFLTEDGVYESLMQSRKPIAKQFKKKVKEILKSIRKHGGYLTPEKVEEVLLNPDTIIKLATQLKEERLMRIEAEKQIEEQKPLVTFAETCIKSNDNVLVRELSKIAKDQGMKIGQNRLYDKLREWGLIMKKPSTEPYQYAMDRDWFVVEEKNVNTPYGVKLTKTTKVTPKGQVYIIEKLKKEFNCN